MKITQLLIGFLAAVSLCFGAMGTAAATPVGIGRPAPDFTTTDIAGQRQSISQYRGRIIVLDWADPECSYDLKHYVSGNIPTMQKEARAEGIVWLTINSADAGQGGDLTGQRLTNWLRQVDWSGAAYIRDPAGLIGRAYRATATPGMYIIDRDGKLVYAGAIDSIPSNEVSDIPRATNYVRQALSEMRAGRPVSVPATRQYGCTIRYMRQANSPR